MSTAIPMEPGAGPSPRTRARIAGFFYLLVFVTGTLAFLSVRGRVTANLLATAFYVVVILLFYELFKPVDRRMSLLAAGFGLLGCLFGALGTFERAPFGINSLVFFGVYCLLIGWLVYRSTFLPRILGVLMAIGGLGWLTFASPSLAAGLRPFNMLPGVVGEGALTVWLLAKGVDVARWNETNRASRGGETK